jgi:hypothetical protein
MNSCGLPSCLTCFQPQLAAVGTCALNIPPNTNLCAPGVGTASCGMSQVTVVAKPQSSSVLPWVIGLGLLAALIFGRER